MEGKSARGVYRGCAFDHKFSKMTAKALRASIPQPCMVPRPPSPLPARQRKLLRIVSTGRKSKSGARQKKNEYPHKSRADAM